MIASEAGSSKAAPSPASARAATSSVAVGASAHSTEATLNSAAPAMKIRRRPYKSANSPPVSSSAA